MSDTNDHPTSSCQLYDFIVCAVIIGTISFAGLIGNVTSFLVLLKHRTETSAICLLQSMAVGDSVLLVTTLGIYVYPAFTAYTRPDQEPHLYFVKFYIWPVAMMTHTATIWLTALVTYNRFGAVCRPIGSARTLSLHQVRLQVLVVVLLSVLYNLPRAFEHYPLTTLSGNLTGDNATTFNLGDSKVYQIVYSNVLYFPVMYIVPLTLLGYLNYRLIRSLKAIREKKETLTGHKPREDHITLCIIVIVCVFFVCQTPALANQIFWAALDQDDRLCGHFHFYYTRLSDALVVLNSSCNFVIYCLFVKSFRKIFLDTLCRKCRKEESATEVTERNGETPGKRSNTETLLTEAV